MLVAMWDDFFASVSAEEFGRASNTVLFCSLSDVGAQAIWCFYIPVFALHHPYEGHHPSPYTVLRLPTKHGVGCSNAGSHSARQRATHFPGAHLWFGLLPSYVTHCRLSHFRIEKKPDPCSLGFPNCAEEAVSSLGTSSWGFVAARPMTKTRRSRNQLIAIIPRRWLAPVKEYGYYQYVTNT
jgi:hypothetical protein